MGEESIEVETKLTLNDYKNFVGLMSKYYNKLDIYTFVAFIVITNLLSTSGGFTIPTILVAACFIYSEFNIRKQYNAKVTIQNNRIYKVNDTGIEEKATDGSFYLFKKWEGIDKIRENKKYILFKTNTKEGIILRKDCLNEIDLLKVEKLAKSKLAQDKFENIDYYRIMLMSVAIAMLLVILVKGVSLLEKVI